MSLQELLISVTKCDKADCKTNRESYGNFKQNYDLFKKQYESFNDGYGNKEINREFIYGKPYKTKK